VTFSCKDKSSFKEPNTKIYQKDDKELLNEIEKIQNAILDDKTEIITDEINMLSDKYNKSKLFEIRVAANLYLNRGEIPDDTYDSYLKEKNLYEKLIRKMFFFDNNIESSLTKIEQTSFTYQKELRDIVQKSYERYNGLESKEFYTLLVIKDTFLIELFDAYLNNSQVNESEKENVIIKVQKYYPELLKSKKKQFN